MLFFSRTVSCWLQSIFFCVFEGFRCSILGQAVASVRKACRSWDLRWERPDSFGDCPAQRVAFFEKGEANSRNVCWLARFWVEGICRWGRSINLCLHSVKMYNNHSYMVGGPRVSCPLVSRFRAPPHRCSGSQGFVMTTNAMNSKYEVCSGDRLEKRPAPEQEP